MSHQHEIRHNWTHAQALEIYQQPFMDLVLQAQTIFREHFAANTVQVCTLHNIKVGGCPEDCGWCGQSIYHGVKSEPLADLASVKNIARTAKEQGATRLCLAASWRSPTKRNLANVITMVQAIKEEGLEACITVGKLNKEAAQQLKEAGLDYYNHNLESSEEHFSKLTTTRTYQDRLDTLQNVREAGLKVCSGGILGMGESLEDRIALLITLANQPTHPQSVPINHLVPVPGTPLANQSKVDDIDFVRCIALARLMMPKAYVRLSGGRAAMSDTMQALCFLAGANSIHYGSEKLLVTPNVATEKDIELFKKLNIEPEVGHNGSKQQLKKISCKIAV